MTAPAIREAFAAAINLGNYLKEAEFYLEFLPEKPRQGMDLESVRVHLIDVRGALGQIAMHLAELHAADAAVLGFIDQTVCANEDSSERVHWRNAEVLELLALVRAQITGPAS